jgi:hypothetical protein
MKDITRNTGKLEIIERLPNSSWGNPRYLLRIDGWTCRTKPDSHLGYKVPDLEGKKVTAIIGTYYGSATVESLWVD